MELESTDGISFVDALPAEVQPVFPCGRVQQPEAASAVLRFLASSEAAPVISKAGLMPIPGR